MLTNMVRSFAAIELFRPPLRADSLFYDLILVIFGSAAIALGAQIAVVLPFSPVPVTAQTLVVLLVGALFGPRVGVLTVLAYIGQGAAGLPVFAGAKFGPAVLLGPTGGYLVGFAAAAAVCGYLARLGWDRRFLTASLMMIAANAAIYACGLAWLACLTGMGRLQIGLDELLKIGCYPFIAGDLVKIAAAVAILPTGWKLLNRNRTRS